MKANRKSLKSNLWTRIQSVQDFQCWKSNHCFEYRFAPSYFLLFRYTRILPVHILTLKKLAKKLVPISIFLRMHIFIYFFGHYFRIHFVCWKMTPATIFSNNLTFLLYSFGGHSLSKRRSSAVTFFFNLLNYFRIWLPFFTKHRPAWINNYSNESYLPCLFRMNAIAELVASSQHLKSSSRNSDGTWHSLSPVTLGVNSFGSTEKLKIRAKKTLKRLWIIWKIALEFFSWSIRSRRGANWIE